MYRLVAHTVRRYGRYFWILVGAVVFLVIHLNTQRCTDLAPGHLVLPLHASPGPSFETLEAILIQKLSEFPFEKSLLPTHHCTNETAVTSCLPQDSCPHFDPSPSVRLRQILATVDTPAFHPFTQAVAATAQGLAPHKYVFVSAASSNHYLQLQELIQSAQLYVFPRLSNFTFVIFDIGLTSDERQTVQDQCQCTVLQFPFSLVPAYMQELFCYTWKPPIIQALIVKSEFLVWMDASIRWNRLSPIHDLFSRAQQRGLQLAINPLGSIGIRTASSTFDFYGDEACQYDPYGEVSGGFGVYHNEPFVRTAILEPWVSCALDKSCMCVPRHQDMLLCRRTPPRPYGECHRFDQSSLGIIVSKLYMERTCLLQLPPRTVYIARGIFVKWLGP